MLRKGDSPVPGFRLVKRLGRGQYGEVWQASGPFGVVRALKFIDVRGKTGLKEFRGIQNVKNISSPHLLGITDIWLLDEDWDVLDETAIRQLEQQSSNTSREITSTVTADLTLGGSKHPAHLVLGMTLANKTLLARLDQCAEETGGGIPVDELLGYMDDAARGIDYLNQNQQLTDSGHPGIQHCDIKPENIMLIGDGVAICDFGLAHIMEGNIQATENPEGTIAYIAPEMLRNRPARTTDQYSLACSYYHLRTNQFPFDEQLGADKLMVQRAKGILDFSAVSGSCERQVLQRATALDAAKRFPSCKTFVSALKRAIDEDKKPPTPPSPRRKWVAIGCMFAVVALAGVGGAVYQGWITIPKPLWRGDGSGKGRDNPPVVKDTGQTGGTENGGLHPRPALEPPPQIRTEDKLRTAHDRLVREIDKDDATDLLDAADKVAQLLQGPAIAQVADEDLVTVATVDLVRARARLGQWPEVQRLLVSDLDTKLKEQERRICELLKILNHTQTDIMPFFDGNNLKFIAGLRDGSLSDDLTKWELDNLAAVKERAFTALVNDQNLWHQYVENDNIRLIFPGRVKEWSDIHRAIAEAEHDLLVALPLSDAQGADLGKKLDGARNALVELEKTSDASTNDTIKKAETRIDYLKTLVTLRTPHAGLAEVNAVRDLNWELFPDVGFADCDALCDAMLDILEQNLLLDEKLDGQVTAVEAFVTKGRVVYRSDNWNRYQSRLSALTTIQTAWHDGAGGQADTLAKLRASARTDGLASTTRLLLDACLFEAAIDKFVRDKSILQYRESTRNLSLELDGFPDNGSVAADYVRFVLARKRYEPGLDKNAIAVLEARLLKEDTAFFETSLTRLKDQPFMKNVVRQEFVQRLLLDAVGELKQPNEPFDHNPYVADPDLGIKQPADKVLVCLNLAKKFGASSDEEQFVRAQLLAEYWCSKPDYENCLRTAGQLKLDPEKPNDGALLFVCAMAYVKAYPDTSGVNNDVRRKAIDAFGKFLKWRETRGVLWSKEDYENLLKPALSFGDGYQQQIENFESEDDRTVEIGDGVPITIRPALARILGAEAKAIMNSPEVERMVLSAKTNLKSRRLEAIKHRYFYFRSAAALDSQLVDFVGQFWALREWLKSARDAGEGRRFERLITNMKPLAERALTKYGKSRMANAMMGEALVLKARYGEVTVTKKMANLSEAINVYLENALAPSQPPMELTDVQLLRQLRSTACVEYAMLLPPGQEKVRILKSATKDASEAAASSYFLTRYDAEIALGNAAEDLAFYCPDNPDDETAGYYKQALMSFSAARKTAERIGMSTNQAMISLGRTRLRYAVFLYKTFRLATADQPKTLEEAQDKYEEAIKELESVIAGDVDARKDEACFYLWNAYRGYSTVFADKGDAASKYLDQADLQLKKATQYASRWKWQEYQITWADLAITQGDLSAAKQRSDKILEQAEKTADTREYNVSPDTVVRALVNVFQAAPVADRHTLFEKYLHRRFVEDSLETRCLWKLLYADQRVGRYETEELKETHDEATSEFRFMKTCVQETLAEVKKISADSDADEAIKSIHRHALVTSALVSYWQWKTATPQTPALLAEAYQDLDRTLHELFDSKNLQRLASCKVYNTLARRQKKTSGDPKIMDANRLAEILLSHYLDVQEMRRTANPALLQQISREADSLVTAASQTIVSPGSRKNIRDRLQKFMNPN